MRNQLASIGDLLHLDIVSSFPSALAAVYILRALPYSSHGWGTDPGRPGARIYFFIVGSSFELRLHLDLLYNHSPDSETVFGYWCAHVLNHIENIYELSLHLFGVE